MQIIGIILIGFLVGLVARWIGPGPHIYGFWITVLIGIVGSVIATYGGQALGLYRAGRPAGFIGSVVGAIVLLALVRLFGH
ncbi:MAG: GlsB/YeaQ/YmgE family stress response membrane protein [Proteobacteria bacterium]|nr:GlsB/YeaQ/YmgE family stress response membrane protein [Pseudomonadota bacterium]MBS0546355.1 GlsB/YeaQ/YmgE family stress response membrane protein [Pseudomonadota bacterium]